jgi:hypothetical protein
MWRLASQARLGPHWSREEGGRGIKRRRRVRLSSGEQVGVCRAVLWRERAPALRKSAWWHSRHGWRPVGGQAEAGRVAASRG